jgi:membrane-associated phospholipid phosphatase
MRQTREVAHQPLPGELTIIRLWQRLPEPVPTIADAVRDLTGTEASIVVLAPVAALAVWRYRARAVAAAAVLLIAMLVVQPVMKDVVDRERPSPDQVEVRASSDSESFPSGHSLGTAAVWGAIALWLWRSDRRPWAVAAALPIPATWIASDVLGVHWPTDSLAGTAVGALAAWLAVALLRIVPPEPVG